MQRQIKVITVSFVFSIFTVACGNTSSKNINQSESAIKPTKIKIGLPTGKTSFANLDVAIAQEKGFFKQQGLDVTIENFDTGVKVVQAVVANGVNIGGASLEPVVNATTAGAKLAIVGTFANRLTIAMVTPKTIKSAADLRNKNVGIQDVGAVREVMTRMVLQKANMTPQDVKYVSVLGPSYIPALISGKIQSAVLQTDQAFEILQRDSRFHVLVDMYKVEPNYYFGSYIVSKDWLAKNPDIAVRYLSALIQAHRFMYQNKAETVRIGTKVTGFNSEVINKTYDVLLVKNKVFPVNDGIEDQRIAYTIQRMKSLGLLKGKEPDLAQLVDRKPITLALKKLGKASEEVVLQK